MHGFQLNLHQLYLNYIPYMCLKLYKTNEIKQACRSEYSQYVLECLKFKSYACYKHICPRHQ